MALIDVPVTGLYGVAFVFSVIELGLAGYLSSIYDQYGYYYEFYNLLQQRLAFLVFASVWTIVVVVGLFALAVLFRPRGETVRAKTWMTPLTVVLTFVTMLFWLAGFAAFAALFIRTADLFAATLAFAILLWLLFLALLAVSLLTAVGFLTSGLPNYGPLVRRKTLP